MCGDLPGGESVSGYHTDILNELIIKRKLFLCIEKKTLLQIPFDRIFLDN